MHLLEIYGFHSPGASQEGEKGGASPKQPVSWDSSSREPVDSVKDSSAVLSDIPWTSACFSQFSNWIFFFSKVAYVCFS